MLSKLKALLSTPAGRKVEHIVVAFCATFGVTLAFNGEHVLSEHGLSALKSAVPALAVAAALAGWQRVRPLIPVTIIKEVETVVTEIRKKKPKSAPPA